MRDENINKELISQIKNATRPDTKLVEETKNRMKLQMQEEMPKRRTFMKKVGVYIASAACIGVLCIYGEKNLKTDNPIPANKESAKVVNENVKEVDISADTSQAAKNTDVGVSAKTDSYESVEELEEDADIIVCGVKVKQNAPVITYQDDQLILGYTLSDFCVKEILKDEEENIQVNDTISILENEFTDEKTNTTYHVAGYSMMDEENEYVLYLSANTFENGVVYYTPLAVNYGITSLGNDYKMEKYITKEGDTVSCNDEINTLRRKIRKQYKE